MQQLTQCSLVLVLVLYALLCEAEKENMELVSQPSILHTHHITPFVTAAVVNTVHERYPIHLDQYE